MARVSSPLEVELTHTHTVAYLGFEVEQVEVSSHLLAMLGFVVGTKEELIHLVEGWGWMPKLS